MSLTQLGKLSGSTITVYLSPVHRRMLQLKNKARTSTIEYFAQCDCGITNSGSTIQSFVPVQHSAIYILPAIISSSLSSEHPFPFLPLLLLFPQKSKCLSRLIKVASHQPKMETQRYLCLIQGMSPCPENYVKDCSEDGGCARQFSLTWKDDEDFPERAVTRSCDSLTLGGTEMEMEVHFWEFICRLSCTQT